MNLLEQMKPDALSKLLDYKTKYPTVGNDLIKTLSAEKFALNLTINDVTTLCSALGINYSPFLGQIFDAFEFQFTTNP
jgi:hypothetical protein